MFPFTDNNFFEKEKNFNYSLFNRHYMRNKKLENFVKKLVLKAMENNGFINYYISEFLQIDLFQLNNNVNDINVFIEVFIINKMSGWNVKELLVRIVGSINNKKNIIEIASFEQIHSKDLGQLIPENSNFYQNDNFIPRY